MAKKICLLVDCLSKGGAERSASILSRLFSLDGNHVTIVSLRNDISYSFSGDLINLGNQESSIKPVKQIQKLINLRKSLLELDPDYIIDFRIRDRFIMEFMISEIVFKPFKGKIIYTIHNYHIDWHLPKGDYFKKLYSDEKIVAVSRAIKSRLEIEKGFQNVYYIPNTFDYLEPESSEFKETKNRYIIAVGRLQNETKQLDKLIEAYSKTTLPQKKVNLLILGEGEDKIQLVQKISHLNLDERVKVLGFKSDAYDYMRNSEFLVLSSRVEGFPYVILEALNLKTPVVSFDCKSGPSEMIEHEVNGLLVEDQDFDALKNAIDRLISDEDLYKKCKLNTHETLKPFGNEAVLEKWKQILQ